MDETNTIGTNAPSEQFRSEIGVPFVDMWKLAAESEGTCSPSSPGQYPRLYALDDSILSAKVKFAHTGLLHGTYRSPGECMGSQKR